jgi:peroxiredoxin
MFTRAKTEPVPEVGADAPEFNLPSAQGGQLSLSMRTPRGPVVVAFYRPGDEEDVEYFKALAAKEDEINLAAGSVVAIGVAEPTEALNFARASGLKSYVLYDYARVTSRQWGLWQKDRRQGDYARRAVFVVGPDRKVAHAWVGERPEPEEILAKVSEITGLPKPPEEPKEDGKEGESEEGSEKPKKMSAEEREKIKAERRAAREAGKSVKTSGPTAPSKDSGDEDKPRKMSAEERERIKAERRAAREAGESLKKPVSAESKEPPEAGSEGTEEEAKKEG